MGQLVFFFHVLFRHPELLEDSVDENFFPGERLRAFAGVLLYAAAGLVGVLTIPALALAIFVLLPLFYGITSHGYAHCKSSDADFRPSIEHRPT
ncbi:hypothetical protein ABZV80_40095 [Streptomyces sp. NPDC005132]|uniref:hypothetical protein n=1 Tax=Streptomyces sp. NPDC005132 TaxID=3154294 RepID=UPI0033A823C3